MPMKVIKIVVQLTGLCKNRRLLIFVLFFFAGIIVFLFLRIP